MACHATDGGRRRPDSTRTATAISISLHLCLMLVSFEYFNGIEVLPPTHNTLY
jgi:hypothetical protein